MIFFRTSLSQGSAQLLRKLGRVAGSGDQNFHFLHFCCIYNHNTPFSFKFYADREQGHGTSQFSNIER